MKSWFYHKAATSLTSCIFLATILSACKTSQNTGDDSETKIVGGKNVSEETSEATVAILTGCTGTFVTLDDYHVKNYVLTTTQCANELTSRDVRGMSKREAVIMENDPAKDLNHTLGLIDYLWLKNPVTGKAPEKTPAKINFDINAAKKGTEIEIIGYGCQDINQPNTDFDNNAVPQKRVGRNRIDTIDTSTGLITFRGPKNNAPNDKATICPRSSMPKDATADEGAPVMWGGKVGAITLYSKVVGNEIVTTAKLLSYKTTDAFLKKWLGQDKANAAPTAEFPDVASEYQWFGTSNGRDSGQNALNIGQNFDWAPWSFKVTCFQNQAAFGVSQHGGSARIGCQSKNSPGKWLDQKVMGIHNSGDETVGRAGDWAPTERKFECPFDYFLAGLAIKTASPMGLTHILCTKTAASTNYPDKQCRSLGTGGKETVCNQDEYIGGVSVNWWAAAKGVTTGGNHIGYVLCCRVK